MARWSVPLLGVVAVLTVACGSTATPTLPGPSSSPPTVGIVGSPAPVASASLDPEALRKTAGAAYLAAVKASKIEQRAADKKCPSKMTLKQAHACFAAQAKVDGDFVAAIKKLVVPPDTAGDLHTLIVRETALQASDLVMAHAGSIKELNDRTADNRRAGDAATAAANQLRSDLNLPPVQF